MVTAFLVKSFEFLGIKKQEISLDKRVFGDKIGLTATLFGCWHNKMTRRPHTQEKSAYLACLSCGARKPVDVKTLETENDFYYPPPIRNIEQI